MKLEYKNFEGMRPAVDERVLGQTEATDAVNCDLRFQTAKPFAAPDTSTLSGATRVPLGYLAASQPENGTPVNHLHDILHNEGGSIPAGMYEVNERGTYIASAVVAQDVHERVYFTRPGGGMYDRGRTDGTGSFVERPVGVAAPVAPDVIDPPSTSPRVDPDPLAFEATWYYFVENIDTGEQVAQGSIADADTSIIFSYETNDINEPVYRYLYNKSYLSTSGSGHVAYGGPGDVYDRTVYNFVMYAELTSAEGRFLGTVYPSPSVREGDTDAFIGGTIAKGTTYQGNDLPIGSTAELEFTDLLAIPAGTEYSHYRSYVFTYITDRGEESAPSAPTDPLAVLPTYKVSLDINVTNAPATAVGVRIYRTETTESGTAFFFVDEVLFSSNPPPVPNPLEYVDFIISVDLPGDTLQTTNWTSPPAGLKGLILSTKNFYAGYVGSKLYLSEPFVPYAWPTDYAIDFTGTILHLTRYGDTLCVFTDREIALIVGNTPLEVRKIKVEGFEQLTSIYSTAEMDGLLYFCTPIGIAAVSGSNVAVVSDAVVSERWWRDNINVSEMRLVTFDNTIYILQQQDGQVYRMGLQEDGGGFVRLSDANARDLYTSSTFLGVVMLLSSPEGDAYVFDTGSAGDRLVKWRGRMEIADIPMAVISVRALASAYPLQFRVYNEDGVQLDITLTSGAVRKLPVMRRGREWSFEIEALSGPADVVSLEVGTSGRAR
jgi:hypothetical protein